MIVDTSALVAILLSRKARATRRPWFETAVRARGGTLRAAAMDIVVPREMPFATEPRERYPTRLHQAGRSKF